jgi:hypothetical protein
LDISQKTFRFVVVVVVVVVVTSSAQDLLTLVKLVRACQFLKEFVNGRFERKRKPGDGSLTETI